MKAGPVDSRVFDRPNGECTALTFRGKPECSLAARHPKTELRPSSVPNQPDEPDLAARAYEIYESKGRVDDEGLADWLQTERESSKS